ncbi:transposase [Cystobacter fuscus]|uniref:Transposase n=1 Tax=Cystobacter fuscus TaxID=43 RepID=A0A250J156_9BACT|nr:transposase [Cystobacter fuscus]
MDAHLGGGGSGESDDQEEFLAPIRGGMNVALNAIVERFTQRSPVTDPRAAKKKVKKGYAPGEAVRKHVATARVLKGEKLS